MLQILSNFIGFILPAIALVVTIVHIAYLISEINNRGSGTLVKIIVFSLLPLFVFLLLLNSILYELSENNSVCNTILICIMGVYITVETLMKNSVIYKVVRLIKRDKLDNGKIDNISIIDGDNIIRAYATSWFNKYWLLTILFNVVIMGISFYSSYKDHDISIFNQNIILFSLIVIVIKYKTIKLLQTETVKINHDHDSTNANTKPI